MKQFLIVSECLTLEPDPNREEGDKRYRLPHIVTVEDDAALVVEGLYVNEETDTATINVTVVQPVMALVDADGNQEVIPLREAQERMLHAKATFEAEQAAEKDAAKGIKRRAAKGGISKGKAQLTLIQGGDPEDLLVPGGDPSDLIIPGDPA